MNTAPERPRILVADDDESVLQLIDDLLCSKGAEVVSVTSGQDALKEAARSVFQLCILDVEMPKMNGLEVCRKMRELPHTARLPILFLTQNNDNAVVTKAFDAGASDFLSKPVITRLLWHRITILLRISELTKETERLNAVMKCLSSGT